MPASQPQAAAAAAPLPEGDATYEKGKATKEKGKEVMIEEVPNDDDDKIEPLPVDSKVIFVEARGEPGVSPMHHHHLESSIGSSIVGDEERSKEKETPSSFRAASTAGVSQSDLSVQQSSLEWRSRSQV